MEQFKKIATLEIYEIDYIDKTHLLDIARLHYPIWFSLTSQLPSFHKMHSLTLEQLSDLSVLPTDDNDVILFTNATKFGLEPSILPMTSAVNLVLSGDDSTTCYSEQNSSWIKEHGDIGIALDSMGEYCRPFASVAFYDIWFGTKHTHLPVRMHTYSHQYLFVSQGSVSVWVANYGLFSSKEYSFDYRAFLFNANDVSSKMTKYGTLVTLTKGQMLFLPPYWWYQIVIDDSHTVGWTISYSTISNMVAHCDLYTRTVYRQFFTRDDTTSQIIHNVHETQTVVLVKEIAST